MPWALILLLIIVVVCPILLWLMYPWGAGLILRPIFLMTRTDEQILAMLSRPGRGPAFISILNDMQRRKLDLSLALPMVVRKMLSRSSLDRYFGSRVMYRFFPDRLAGVAYNPWRVSRDARAHLETLLTPHTGEAIASATESVRTP